MPGDVQINMISGRRLKRLSTMEKVTMILDDVTHGRVVILEHGLDPFEEAKLIETTMTRISHDIFSGIEIQSYPHQQKSSLARLFGGNGSRMTVIGPADRMKTIRRERDLISALIT
jgi:hypothetical protein